MKNENLNDKLNEECNKLKQLVTKANYCNIPTRQLYERAGKPLTDEHPAWKNANSRQYKAKSYNTGNKYNV